MGLLKGLFKKKTFDAEEMQKHDESKKEGLERVLGPMHDTVGHALLPFYLGGAVDMYYFGHAIDGTAFVTMELIGPDGKGPKPNATGTYELIAFTRHRLAAPGEENTPEFTAIERRICGIFTSVGHYSHSAVLNANDTGEIPVGGSETRCVVFDEFKNDQADFEIDGHKHGLLLCIEVFRSEMQFAMKNGSESLLRKLRFAGLAV